PRRHTRPMPMSKQIRATPFSLLLVLGSAAGAHAQQGFALKGHYIFNSSSVNEERADTLPDASGVSIGAEFVLPLGIGVGVSGYAAGGATDQDVETSALTVLAEANYFLNLPLLPVSPYAGVHAGLGRFSKEDLNDPQAPDIEDTRTQLGFQVGVRVQLGSMLGLDAQYRRVSTSAAENQGGDLERNQYLVGVTLF
ncbi:MAG TPA: outer membrane beta-barrel protein, partial [Longimicrobiaceae bacterium]|nr:outer membrane beta-barrel protein [Longimicrobiaceae bacterium]